MHIALNGMQFQSDSQVVVYQLTNDGFVCPFPQCVSFTTSGQCYNFLEIVSTMKTVFQEAVNIKVAYRGQTPKVVSYKYYRGSLPAPKNSKTVACCLQQMQRRRHGNSLDICADS